MCVRVGGSPVGWHGVYDFVMHVLRGYILFVIRVRVVTCWVAWNAAVGTPLVHT